MLKLCGHEFIIFLSCCSPQNQSEVRLKAKISKLLAGHGCKVIDSAELKTDRCIIDEIFDITNTVDAVVSLAFPRNSFSSAGAINQHGTSPWIHVEATLAYVLKTPLLLIGDQALCRHGVFDQRSMSCTRLFIESGKLDEAAYIDVAQGVAKFLEEHLAAKVKVCSNNRFPRLIENAISRGDR